MSKKMRYYSRRKVNVHMNCSGSLNETDGGWTMTLTLCGDGGQEELDHASAWLRHIIAESVPSASFEKFKLS